MGAISNRPPGVSLEEALTKFFTELDVTFTDPVITGAIKDSNGNTLLDFLGIADAVNNLRIQNAATGGDVDIYTLGTDDTINVAVRPKGTNGQFRIKDAAGQLIAFFQGVASAVNRIRFMSAASGSGPSIDANGSDDHIDINVNPKGAGVFKSGGNPVGVKVAVPASASSAGTPGQWAADSQYLYICTDTDTWLRAEIATWA